MKFLSSAALAALCGTALTVTAAAQVPTLSTEVVASGLNRPVYATSPSSTDSRIFILTQSGQIRVVENGSLLPAPFLNIASRVNSGGNEQGLLGLAFHPDFANNGYFYVDYTRSGDGATVVERYEVSAGNPNVADFNSNTLMVGPISQPFSNHNAGCIQFGTDGYLYVANGDGGSGGDPGCRAQNPQNLLGKMLRVDVDQNPNGPAVAPASNPFVGNPAVNDLIWAVGLRNPWRFSFDRLTDDLWIGDVGQNALEEINFVAASSNGGENYGWKIMEGTNCFSTAACGGIAGLPACNSPTLTDPVRTEPTSSNCAIVGGYRYRGPAIPALQGTYIYGDNCSGNVYAFEFVSGAVQNRRVITGQVGSGTLYSFGEDSDGEILICAGNGVNRIVSEGLLTSFDVGPGTVGSNGEVPRHDVVGSFGGGNIASLRLRSAPPTSSAALLLSDTAGSVPLGFPGFGTIVPFPVVASVPLVTDANGGFLLQLPPAGGLADLFHQVAIIDPAIGGVTLSNAVRTLFFEVPGPEISAVSPAGGAAGTVVTVTGQNFAPGVSVVLGGTNITPTTVSPTALTFTIPMGVGCDTTLEVRNPVGTFDLVNFNESPVVTSTFFSPGPSAGGALFAVNGEGFVTGTTVTIGGNPATITALSPTAIFMLTPPGAPGTVPVVVTTPAGCTVSTTYTYL